MKKQLAFSIYLVIFLCTQISARNPALDSALKYYDIGYYSKALEFASRAYQEIPGPVSKLNRETVETIILVANIHSELLNYQSAITYYYELLGLMRNARYPKYIYFETLSYLGELLAGDGRFREMDSLYDNTIRSYPKWDDTHTLNTYRISTLLEFNLEDKAYELNDSLDEEYNEVFDEYDEGAEEEYFNNRADARAYLDSVALNRWNEFNLRKEKDELEQAAILFDIGWKYDSLNFYNEADSIFAACGTYATTHLGRENEITIQTLMKRAGIRKNRGDYMGAYELILKAEPLARKAYGESSVLYGDVLRYMADYLSFLGRENEALEYFEKTLSIFRSQLSLVNNLYSALIMDMSSCTEVSGMLNEIIRATEDRGVYCNSCYSYLLLIQAKEIEKKSRVREAEALYFRALESLPGFDEEGNSEIEVALADFYVRCRALGLTDSLEHYGQYIPVEVDGKTTWILSVKDPDDPYYDSRLERIYDEAIAQTIEESGSLHPAVADLELSKSLLYWGWQPQFETIVQFNKTLKVYLEITGKVFPFLTETERISFYNSNKKALESFMAYIVSEKLENPMISASSKGYKDLAELNQVIGGDSINFTVRKTIDKSYFMPQYSSPGILLNYRLATKGLIYESVSGTRKRIMESNDSLLIDKFRSWQSLKEMAAGLQTDHEKTLSGQIDSINLVADSLERWLSIRSEAFRSQNENVRITWKDLLSTMDRSDGAVEVIRCHHPMYYRTLGKGYEDSVYYGFLIVSKYMGGTVSLVILTHGRDLEAKYYPYYSNSIRYKTDDTLSVRWFWSELEKTIKSNYIRGKIYFSADGVYNKINLNTLRWPGGNYIIDSYDIHMVSNLKDIMQMNKATGPGNQESILIGNPDFGNKTTGANPDTLKERSMGIENLMRGGLEALPGTAKEVDLIGNTLTAKGWRVLRLEGLQASESNLKKVDSPDILHIATHGFFNDEVTAGNPLFNCGLLMSEVGEETSSGDDGIFTGIEAVDLDLEGCRLVVLSACESGLGKVETGEGVYGLQRAFKIANASGTLMSLWKVNDTATQELMSAFYMNLGSGQETYSSFKSAQLVLRKKYKHPYYWGAFVFSGI
ncbi:MAG TPA: CHAT domain-containing tetratricopeptide repeat protein [Cyclobacteriaceae bacterium]|nr:CHAT domain-containing tetratricopeptide repeat protein [Cyclobacteriaceae bacterium]